VSAVHIGVDLDNTLVDYTAVFHPVAEQLGLVEPGLQHQTKVSIKARLIERDPSEVLWMRLQGQVYGRFLGKARLYPGAVDCLAFARAKGARISIVSHKTRLGHFDPDQVDLRQAARDWLSANGLFDRRGPGIVSADVHFTETRDAKLACIAEIGCNIFVDDLPEVLTDTRFPADVEPLWFAGNQAGPAPQGLAAYRTWQEIKARLDEIL
jgi:hypothetical protein